MWLWQNRPNYFVTRQKGPTCWFHSVLNGFLLSKFGRIYLHHITKNVITKNVSVNSCPIPGSPAVYSIIKQYLKKGINNKNEIVRIFEPTRNPYLGFDGRKLYRYFPDVKLTRFANGVPSPHEKGYTLSHAYIILDVHYKNKSEIDNTHAIAGVIDKKGDYYIYDSSFAMYKKINSRWDTKEGKQQIIDIMTEARAGREDFSHVRGTNVFIPNKLINVESNKITRNFNNNGPKNLDIGLINTRMRAEIERGNRNWQLNNLIHKFYAPVSKRFLNISKMISEIKKGDMNNQLIVKKTNYKSITDAKISRVKSLISEILKGNRNAQLNIQQKNVNKIKIAKQQRMIIKKLENVGLKNGFITHMRNIKKIDPTFNFDVKNGNSTQLHLAKSMAVGRLIQKLKLLLSKQNLTNNNTALLKFNYKMFKSFQNKALLTKIPRRLPPILPSRTT